MDPAETVYRERLAENQALMDRERRRHFRLGYGKLALFLAGVATAVALLHTRGAHTLIALALLLLAFIAFIVLHDRVLRRLHRCERVADFYSRAIARLENRWAGAGETGDCFFDPAHPYARDLDLFGPGSLFQLLCTARTRSGQETLARWLLHPAPPEEVLLRHAAVLELQGRVPLRERLFTAGEAAPLTLPPEAIAEWGEGSPIFRSRWLPAALALLAALWIASIAVWVVTRSWDLLLALSLLNYAVSYALQSRVDHSVQGVEAAAPDLSIFASVLELMEQENGASPYLRRLRASITIHGLPASRAVRRLARLFDWLEDRRNGFVRLFNPFVFYAAQLTMGAERWRTRFGPSIRGWLTAVGDFEALSALSGYAYEHPSDVLPEFVTETAHFHAEGLAHPLLPADRAVRNDLTLAAEGAPRLLIVSGPNMAGKSTFLRGVGLNAVLAQCGAPVRAHRLRLSPLAVGASICVLDSLQGGVSRFYAEIQRLKLLADLAAGPLPLLFLLDELLSGTNSHDRFEGTRSVVRELVRRHAIGLVTTHDLALTRIPELLGPAASNVHFEDTLRDGQLAFDYRLHPGIVQTSNALRLMQAIGLHFDDDAPAASPAPVAPL